jgi:hypothetical protein
MKNLKDFTKQTSKLRDAMLAEINNFFNENSGTEIDVEEVEGGSINVRGDKDCSTITENGTVGVDADFPFDELDLCDLECIIDIINTYIDNLNKTMDKCRDNNF